MKTPSMFNREGDNSIPCVSRLNITIPPTSLRTLTLISILAVFGVNTPSFAQDFLFAGKIGSTNEDSGEDLVVDSQGNVIVTGLFAGTVDFDMSVGGVFNMTSAGLDDGFVAKYDASGNFIWAVQFGGTDSDFGHGITVDQNDNIVVTGSFSGTADFLPGSGGPTLVSQGSNDIYILKLDPDGALDFVVRIGGTGDDVGHDIDVDGAGNIHLAGAFSETVDFDPGAGTFNLTSDGNLDLVLARYDPQGNFMWAFNGTGGNANQRVWSVNADDAGNSFVSGWFKNTPDMDPGPGVFILPNEGLADGYLGKYDPDGNLLWVFNFGSDSRDQGMKHSIDAAGNVYLGGFFRNTVDFDPGPGQLLLTASGTQDAFLAKYNTDGEVQWAFNLENAGGPENSQGLSTTTDAFGNTTLTGQFLGSMDIDPGPGVTQLNASGGNDAYLITYNTDGELLWGGILGGDGSDVGKGVISDNAGNVYVTGTFRGTADFNIDPNSSFELSSDGLSDIFLVKYFNMSTGNPLPMASFTYTENDLTIDFDGSGSTDDGSVEVWNWDFGDGENGNGEFTSHTYAAPGTYEVTLTVNDDLGASGSTTQMIDVGNPPPVPSFTATQTPGTLDVDFDASGTTDDGSITDWSWDFGDGETGSGMTTIHPYAAAGTYTVTLTVTDNEGAMAEVSMDVVVIENADPVASFTATQTAGTLDVDFDGSASSDDGAIVSWDWDFGDGNSDSGETVAHTYAAPGTYTVMLTVTDDMGATGADTQEVEVADSNLEPVAAFTATQVAGTLDVDFDGSGSSDDGTITDWDWDFGDGNSGAGETASHTYAAAGTYTVMLTVTDDGGLTGSVSQEVTVTDPNAEGPFLESGGIVVMEAENFHVRIDRSGHSWVENTDNAGFSGASAMLSDPDDGTSIVSDIQTTSPELSFDMDISTTGDYHVWVRVWADNTGGNSIHVGVDGIIDPLSKGIRWQTTGSWVWEEHGRGSTSLVQNIATAGVYTFNLWMRQDGALVDKILMTTDAGFVPVDEGPAESPRGTAAPTAQNGAKARDQLALDAAVEAVEIPESFDLAANYPNPFNPTTTIAFDLPEASDVRLEVYDMMGRRIATLVNGQMGAGRYEAIWNATSDAGVSVASGVYLYRLRAGSFVAVKSMILMK